MEKSSGKISWRAPELHTGKSSGNQTIQMHMCHLQVNPKKNPKLGEK
jgi:hypothetical protein